MTKPLSKQQRAILLYLSSRKGQNLLRFHKNTIDSMIVRGFIRKNPNPVLLPEFEITAAGVARLKLKAGRPRLPSWKKGNKDVPSPINQLALAFEE